LQEIQSFKVSLQAGNKKNYSTLLANCKFHFGSPEHHSFAETLNLGLEDSKNFHLAQVKKVFYIKTVARVPRVEILIAAG